MIAYASCVSCGEHVEWAVWSVSRRFVSLDVGSHRDGCIEVIERKPGRSTVVQLVPLASREPGRLYRRAHRCSA